MEVIVMLSIVGAVLSLISFPCTLGHIKRVEDMKIGKVSWWSVALVGYLAIAASTMISLVLTQVLVGITALVTVWLIIKAVRIKMGCPICAMMWIVNAILVGVTFA